MKNYYIFLLILLFSLNLQAQTNCSEADSDMNYAYSHVKSAYDSNNISDLKYFAHRSLEAFKRAKPVLKKCGCEPVHAASSNAIDLLTKVDPAETYEDGRFFVKRAREYAREAIGELDNCNQISLDEEEMLDLEMEQAQLKQKQLELELKQEELKLKLAEQKQREVRVQKEILITNYETAIASNIKSYNDALRICDCNSRIDDDFNYLEKPFSKSYNDIKKHYLEIIRKLSEMYVSKLDGCVLKKGAMTVQN